MTQEDLPVLSQNIISVRAHFLGQRLDLRSFEQTHRIAMTPLLVRAGSSGCAVLFRYGVVVLFGLDSIEEASFLSNIQSMNLEPYDSPEKDDARITVVANTLEGIEQGNIVINKLATQHFQLVATILAKSLVLSHYESRVANSFDRIEPLAVSLQKGGVHRGGRELLAHIGDTLTILSKMVGRAEVSEKPEIIWEYPEYERLYMRLEDEYEIKERHIALERKLDLVSRTAETLLELLQHRRSLRVEWYIVILIVVDILVSLGEKFFV